MKNGKYSHNRKRRLRWSKQLTLLASVAVLLIGVIGGTMAYLIDTSGPVKNIFDPGKVDITVDEDFDGSVKNEVKITLSKDSVNAKIRAQVIITWQNSAGEVYPARPVEGTDYSITWTKDGWSDADSTGWYTYKSTVTPGNSTGVLFTACKPLKACPDTNYKLVVDIIADAIQADGVASR